MSKFTSSFLQAIMDGMRRRINATMRELLAFQYLEPKVFSSAFVTYKLPNN